MLPGSIGDELVACVAPIDCVVSGVALVAEPMLGNGMEEEVEGAT